VIALQEIKPRIYQVAIIYYTEIILKKNHLFHFHPFPWNLRHPYIISEKIEKQRAYNRHPVYSIKVARAFWGIILEHKEKN